MDEIWKPIKGFETLYEISNLGKVKSLPKQSGFLKRKERIMSLTDNKKGYLYVTFEVNGKRSRFYVHRLVADHFIPNPNNLETVNHKDKNRKNNHVDNLEWMSYSENNQHGECQIKAGKARRIPIYQCDLNGNIIKEWCCAKVAAEELGYSSNSGICACCRGKIKSHKGYIWKYV